MNGKYHRRFGSCRSPDDPEMVARLLPVIVHSTKRRAIHPSNDDESPVVKRVTYLEHPLFCCRLIHKQHTCYRMYRREDQAETGLKRLTEGC